MVTIRMQVNWASFYILTDVSIGFSNFTIRPIIEIGWTDVKALGIHSPQWTGFFWSVLWCLILAPLMKLPGLVDVLVWSGLIWSDLR